MNFRLDYGLKFISRNQSVLWKLRKHHSQVFFKDTDQMCRNLEVLNFRAKYKIAFCSTPSFAEHHSRNASKVKYETAIQNSVKCCSSREKILDLFTKILLNIFYETNRISVTNHRKI